MKAPFSSSCEVCCGVLLIAVVVCAQLAAGQSGRPVSPYSNRPPSAAVRYSSPDSAQSQTFPPPEQVLYAFQGGNDGSGPSSSLIFDSAGNLYGTTPGGGGGSCACGTVFELSPSSNGTWSETVLYRFQGGSDGSLPSSGLIFDKAGNLYGTTVGGGGTADAGTVYELSPNGSGGWTESVLYSFQGSPDGAGPAGVVFDTSGNLFGTTGQGGNGGCDHDQSDACGTVFELSPNGGGGWTEKILYSFSPGGDVNTTDGWSPTLGLTFDGSGNLYGTTASGGTGVNCDGYVGGGGGCGTAFELIPNGGVWTETVLYSFGDGTDGSSPNGGLIFDQSGNLYGTARGGGNTASSGTVFELSPNGSGGWTETTLYEFQGGTDGSDPFAGLIFDSTGNLYGSTYSGGNTNCPVGETVGCGTVFELSPNGSGSWTETRLYSFAGGNDGQAPSSPVIFDQAGHLYGTTLQGGGATGCGNTFGCGTAFEVTKAPFVVFSPTSVNFGTSFVNTNGTNDGQVTVTLTNNGAATLVVSSIQITGTNSNQFGQSNNCPASVAANATCTITVSFLATAAGVANALLTVADNSAPGGVQSVALTGTAVPALTFSPASLVFPGQYVGTAGLNQNVTLTNSNNIGAVSITSVIASPSSDFSQLSGCGSSIAVGVSCQIGVFFDPSASGARTGTLTITSNPGGVQVVTLSGTGEDFSLSASASSQTVSPGQSASYSLTLSPEGGFKQTVQLSCSGAPAQTTCSVSPASMTLNGSSAQTVTVTVTTSGASASLQSPARLRLAYGLWLGLPGVFGFFLVLPGSQRSRQRGKLIVLVLLCVLTMLMMPACGGGSSSNNGPGGTQAGTYNLTVTGVFTSGSTNLTHTTKLTLLVQ